MYMAAGSGYRPIRKCRDGYNVRLEVGEGASARTESLIGRLDSFFQRKHHRRECSDGGGFVFRRGGSEVA